MSPAVRGSTRAERDESRAKVRMERRRGFYRKRLAEAEALDKDSTEQMVAVATDYVKALGGCLDDVGRVRLAGDLFDFVNERLDPL